MCVRRSRHTLDDDRRMKRWVFRVRIRDRAATILGAVGGDDVVLRLPVAFS